MEVEVITFNDWKKEKFPKEQVVVTVSKSNDWSKGLSPFVLGPCELWGGHISKNMENAWQGSKVYPEHVDSNNKVTDKWFKWAKEEWDCDRAHRYPMGKGAIPLFSYWDGEYLTYIQARKRIYIPLYYKAVIKTDAWKKLQDLYNKLKNEERDLYLVDFDAYRHKKEGLGYKDVINNDKKKMGHAFVLGMALEIQEKLEASIKRSSNGHTDVVV